MEAHWVTGAAQDENFGNGRTVSDTAKRAKDAPPCRERRGSVNTACVRVGSLQATKNVRVRPKPNARDAPFVSDQVRCVQWGKGAGATRLLGAARRARLCMQFTRIAVRL
eukprot:4946408-Pleurochrysis_carterae.AAC.1